ncbi:MAG: TetR/AcrR family transcriptional regulator [Prevotella sp.]|nr:TetR/AcrR family transcriptional regulator [Prevotella sp.]
MQTSNISIHDKIVEHALNMFKMHGIKAVRMDDVAKTLRISKRTLYEQFNDKEALLMECVKYNAIKERDIYEDYKQRASSSVEMLCFIIKHNIDEFSRYSPNFFSEIMKYQPIREYMEERAEYEREEKETFFKKGVEEGYLVKGINFQLLGIINKAAVDYLISNKVYKQYSLQEVFNTFITLFIRGILTEKGHKELEKHLGNLI